MATIELTDANFETEVLKSESPALVDFWAEWCGPCKMIAPIVEEVGKEYAGRLKVGKVNVDIEKNVAGQFGIRSIPTLLLFKDGEVLDRIVGTVPKTEIVKQIEKLLATTGAS